MERPGVHMLGPISATPHERGGAVRTDIDGEDAPRDAEEESGDELNTGEGRGAEPISG